MRMGLPRGGGDVRFELSQGREIIVGAHQEDAGIPDETALRQHVLRTGQLGLFHEFERCRQAAVAQRDIVHLDIAIAGFRPFGTDAERHHPPIARDRHGLRHGGQKFGGVGDHMVARHHQQQCIAAARFQGRQGNGRGGVAGGRLQDDRRRLQSKIGQLLFDHIGMAAIADNDRCGKACRVTATLCRQLEHGLVAGKRQKLLRSLVSRKGPQARAGTAGQNHGMNDHALSQATSMRASGDAWMSCRFSV